MTISPRTSTILSPRSTTASAFTLVELLVVITIIGILAAIALPVYGKVQETARTTLCSSNLRQVGVGLLSYAGEHDGIFPVAGAVIVHGAVDGTTGQPGWTEQIEPYGGVEKKIFKCPSSSKLYVNNATYSYFMGCHAAYLREGKFAPLRQTLISTPSKYILGGDISSNMFTSTDADKDDYTMNPAFSGVSSTLHSGKVNILFADGHVLAASSFDVNNMTVCYEGVNVTGSTY